MKWISVEDRLPPMTPMYDNGPRSSAQILVVISGRVVEGCLEETYEQRKPKWRTGFARGTVTHWMPMPEPPKGKDRGK